MKMIDYRKTTQTTIRKSRFAGGHGWVILVAGVVLLASSRAECASMGGSTIYAKSMANTDVIAAVALAQDGDTVVVPAGTAQWTKCVVISNAITLQFAGIGQSIVRDYIVCPQAGNNPPWSQAVVTFFTTSNKLYRLSGLEVDAGLIRAKTNCFVHGAVEIMGTTTGCRVDHCSFNNLNDDAIYYYNAACGVVDHCSFYNLQGVEGHALVIMHESWANQSFGDGSWDTPVQWGTTNAVYIEDCGFTNTFSATGGWAWIDSFAGAHWVFRHNFVLNGFLCNHGTESTGLFRGTRSEEVYLNTFIQSNIYANTVSFRSGSGVLWSNTAVGYQSLANLHNYRCSDYFPYWGAADGTNVLDSNTNNSASLFTVTHTGANNSTVLVVSNANWIPNQWAGYSVIDINTPGTTNFGMIYSNSVTSAYLQGPQVHTSTMFNTGDVVRFYLVAHALDMPGSGPCAALTRDPNTFYPLAPWPSQAIEPVYAWGNTLDGTVGTLASPFPIISEGTYFFNGVAKPGYAPLTYPHPLTLVGSTLLAVAPLPPTGLRVVGGN
jgi:hypothetical protein